MFSTVRYFIKTSIIFLVIGILTGLYMLLAEEFFNQYPHPELVSAHTHIILLGSIMMMIMGVALWFFPRAEKDDKLYKPGLILFVYYLFTVSTLLRFISQCLFAFNSFEFLKWIIVISSVMQVIALILFFISMWGRIRPVGSHIREAKGERF
jgi:heme/copper-type cytochrome/quinol oxidase subunit 1